MVRRRLQQFKKIALVVFALGFFVSALPIATLLSSHEACCQEESARVGNAEHDENCQNLPVGHQHPAHHCADACALGHCHAGHGATVAKAIFSILPSSALRLGLLGAPAWVYRNPYLGKALQPPRA